MSLGYEPSSEPLHISACVTVYLVSRKLSHEGTSAAYGVQCVRGLMHAILSHRMYLLISFRKSTPPHNRQLGVNYY